MAKHVCPNQFHAEGAKGGSFIECYPGDKEETIHLRVGHSCIILHDADIPTTWLAEIIAIARDHKGGIAGFLREHNWDGDSYALMCDPAPEK